MGAVWYKMQRRKEVQVDEHLPSVTLSSQLLSQFSSLYTNYQLFSLPSVTLFLFVLKPIIILDISHNSDNTLRHFYRNRHSKNTRWVQVCITYLHTPPYRKSSRVIQAIPLFLVLYHLLCYGIPHPQVNKDPDSVLQPPNFRLLFVDSDIL